MFKNLRINIGRYLLKKEITYVIRNRAVHNFDSAHRIGVLYDATNRRTYDRVKDFVQYLKEKKKQVVSLGFINSNDPNQLPKTQLEYRYFTKKELNWCFEPKSIEVKNFIQEDYDVLIDLCIDKCFPIRYICGLSKAKFKVGPSGENSMVYYDLILNIEKRKTLENYIIHLKHYLSIINKKE
ncbi:MAG: hypothetical protein ABII90_14045 [Bacteroidota bacterium]